jgi:uncharacterized membrane protein
MRIAGLLVGMLLLVSVDARATFFKYKDSSGAIVITDKMENVPKKYRKKCKAIFDENLDAKDSLKRRWAESKEAREKQKQEEQKSKQAEKSKLKPSDGKRLVIKVDEETGEVIRTME